MSYTGKNGYKRATEYNVIYNNMRGVDFSLDGSGISKNRFAYLENMYRDYDGIGSGMVESIPGFRKIYSAEEVINGLHPYKAKNGSKRLVIHTKTRLRELDITNPDEVIEISTLSGISNTKSKSFFAKDTLFVLDSKSFFKISEEKREKLNDSSSDIYIPTTYFNGVEYEQRNLLTRSFFEVYNLGSCESSAHGTDNISYAITDEENAECAVTGYSGEDTDVYIPSRVIIGDKYYSVKRIESYAFQANKKITSCVIANGVSYVGVMAFYKCDALRSVIIPDTVTEIGNGCFADCKALSELHFGLALRKIGLALINTCPSLDRITYAGSDTDFTKIENTSALGSVEIVYNHIKTAITVSVKVNSPCVSVESVCAGEEALSFRTATKNGLCEKVIITLSNKANYQGRDIKIKGTLSSDPDDYKNIHRGFLASNYTGEKSVAQAIFECKIAESYDGRIFLTGNSDYPGFCFYSAIDCTGENNPLYFGDMNYFKDGVGNFDNIAMLAAGDSLAVFKADDDGGGSIYYHTPRDTGVDVIPRIYPVSYIHSGICAKGDVISFFDDPIFVSERGISALSKKTINLERSVAVRSTNVNPKLLCENLSELKLAVWRGYLVVLAGEHIYLADSRALFEGVCGDFEYEWYFLSGIGSYTDDSRVYKYASSSHTGYSIHEKTDTVAEGTVYGSYDGREQIYYVIENDTKYEVYPTDELKGGVFHPATDIVSVENLLLLATKNGDVLVFNNDKRGVAPPSLSNEPGFDKEDYEKIYGARIHPYYYSFANHAPRYAVQTKKDNSSIPHLEKSTVKGSLSVKCRAVSTGKLICEVGCDNVGYREVCSFPSSGLSFLDLDFSNLSLTTDDVYTVPIGEKSKGWIEKQITLYTEEYGSPFGIYTIAYRFFVKGKIKKSR